MKKLLLYTLYGGLFILTFCLSVLVLLFGTIALFNWNRWAAGLLIFLVLSFLTGWVGAED